jgi:hypothetical protein
MAKLTGKNALICGDDQTIKITAPFDLTGYTLTFTVKLPTSLSGASDAGAPLQVVYVCPADADTIAGIAYIPLTETDTRITAGKYVYDIQFVDGDGNKVSTRRKEIEFVEDVTKA